MERNRIQLGKLFLMLIVASTLLFVSDKLRWIRPIRAVIEEQIARVRGLEHQVTLTEKIQLLEASFSSKEEEIKRLTGENEEIRKQLQAPLPPDIIFIPSVVVSIFEEGQEKLMNVAVGEEGGIREGMPVVYESILIGRVIRTSSYNSTIRLLSSPESKIAIKTNRGTQGLVVGSPEIHTYKEAMVDRVLQEEPLHQDDDLVTSGEDGLPPDLLVGKVTMLLSESREPFQKATVLLTLDPEALTRVFIIDRK